MKHSLKFTIISAIAFGTFSCTNLDEELKSSYTKSFAPANQGVGIKNNVNKPLPNDGLQGAFGKLTSGTATNGGFFQVQELSSDEAVIAQKGGDWFDGGVYIAIHQHAFSPTTASINGAWGDAYSGIFQCNELLGKSPTVSQTAQLRTLRAYYYWRLLDLFGRVKIVTATGVDAPQSTRLQLYNFVETELLAVLPNLPAGKQEYGRVSKGAANALLCRIYLNAAIYTGDANGQNGTPQWQKAIDKADDVINSGIYSLSTTYKAIFAPDNVENSEHIFVVPFDEATGTGMNIAQMTLHYPSQLTYLLAEQPWNGYAAMEDFYKSYDDPNDSRKLNNFIVGPQVDVSGNPILDLAFDKADEDGPAINYTPKINQLFPNASRQSGARLGKFSFKLGQFSNMDNDYPLLRYSEVLLNKAEAIARKNNNNFSDPTVLSLVNPIRLRAGASAFTSMTEGQMLAERGRELFIEGLRRPDLIRFGAWGNAWWEKAGHAAFDYRVVMAIPIEQIQAASIANPLTQNSGY